MYINVGEDSIIWSREIIAILNQKNIHESSLIQEFFEKNQNKIIDLTNGSFKSIIITTNNIILSPLSSNTLKRRQMEHRLENS